MNHNRFVFASWIVVMGALAAGVWAAPARIPDEIKNWPNVPLPANQKKVTVTVLMELVKGLSNPSAAAQREAREALVAETRLADGRTLAKAPYLDEYTLQLNQAIQPLLGKGPMRVRLNAAIVVARVAEAAPTLRLEPAVRALLEKSQPDVLALWGVKAAGSIISTSMELGQPSTLLKDFLPAIRHHESAAVVQEGYRALSINGELANRQLVNKHATPLLLELLAYRVNRYKDASKVIDEPEIEGEPVLYLTRQGVFDSLSPAQRAQVVDLVRGLLEGSVAQAQNSGASAAQLEQLARLVKYAALCLRVLASNPSINSSELQSGVARAASLAPNAMPDDIVRAIRPAIKALEAVRKAYP